MFRNIRGKLIVSAFIALSTGGLIACELKSEPVMTTAEEKAGYSIGYKIGEDLKAETPDLELELLLRGLRDGLSKADPLLTDEEVEEVRQAFMEKRLAARRALSEERLAKERAFLEENAEKEGVVELPSGLQYQVLTPGDGARPTAGDNVKVHYRGYFIDGTEFESTYAEDQPAVFPVRGVIPGWTEALQLMKEGAKWKLFVPAELAYGEQGAGDIIGPDETLIFEIELIGIH